MNNRIALVNPAEEILAKAELPVNTANGLEVNSQAQLEQAGEIVRILKDLQDEVNKVFEPLVKQAFATHKAVKKAQNDHLQPLQEAEAVLRARINHFLRGEELKRILAEQNRQKAEENLRLQPAAEKPTFSASAVPAPRLPEVPAPPKAAGMSTVQDWKWKLVDAALIPVEFWMLDEEKINTVVKAMQKDTQIPGIEVYPEARAVIRR